VEDRRRDHLVAVVAAAEQLGDLERVQDERGAVGRAALAAMAERGERERAARQRALVEQARKRSGASAPAGMPQDYGAYASAMLKFATLRR
jgi:hypothetical protein